MNDAELLLTPEERLDAENRALEFLHSQGKIIGKDDFTSVDIAFTVRLFIATAQLAKAHPIIEKQWAEPVFNLLCDIGVCSKDATPTTNLVLMTLQEAVGKVSKESIEKQERERITVIIGDILDVGAKQEKENWVKTWFVVKNLLIKLRQTLKVREN